MPVPTTFGVYASKTTGGGGGGGFVGASSLSTASTSAVISFSALGAQVGDLAVINSYTPVGTNPANVAGWNRDPYTWTNGYGYVTVWLWKVLTSGDLSGPVTVTGLQPTGGQSGVSWGVWRGPTVATRVSTFITTATTSATTPGFTKNASSKVIALFLADRSGSGSPVSPANFTLRTSVLVNSGAFGAMAIADLTTPIVYTNGSSMIWTNLNPSFDHLAAAWELT